MYRAIDKFWKTRPQWLRNAILISIAMLMVALTAHAANLLERAKWITIGAVTGMVSFFVITGFLRHILLLPISLGLMFNAEMLLLYKTGSESSGLSSRADNVLVQFGVLSSAVLGFCLTARFVYWLDDRAIERRARLKKESRDRQQRRQRVRRQRRQRKKQRRIAW